MFCCEALEDVYEGKKMGQLDFLASKVEELDTDFKTWTTKYRCKVCGQNWLEVYESKGHGDVPSVKKVQA